MYLLIFFFFLSQIYEENSQAVEMVTFLLMLEWLMVSWLIDFQAGRDLNIVCTRVGIAAGLVESLPAMNLSLVMQKDKTKPKETHNQKPFYQCLWFSKLGKGGLTFNPMGPVDNTEVWQVTEFW